MHPVSLILAILSPLLIGNTLGARVNNYPINVQLPTLVGSSYGVPGRNASYDYIIVGGGTAGLAVASRLAANFSVAVVEAGGLYQIENGNVSSIPGLAAANDVSPDAPLAPLIDWNLKTIPMIGAANRSLYYARGKTLGGSSARNLLVYHRPTRGSMQKWADDVGDKSYTWDAVTPYFDRCVAITAPRNTGPLANLTRFFNDSTLLASASGGPVQVSWSTYIPQVFSWYYRAFNLAGFQTDTKAFLGGALNGVALSPTTVDPLVQQRSSSQTSYLYRAMLETDITVYTHSLVKQVTFANSTSASGVRVISDGREFHLTAKREVVLAAGAFQSPQILMVSGIGPRATLERFNITVRKELSGVGQNMWDHMYFPTSYPITLPASSLFSDGSPGGPTVEQQYLVNKTGPLAGTPIPLGWESLVGRSLPNISLSNSTVQALAQFPSDWPNLEYIAGGGVDSGAILVALITPLSRGNVTIRSADTSDPPVINPNYLTHPADIEILSTGLKRARAIWKQMAPVINGTELAPGINITTDAQIEGFIRATISPVWHPASTCKMGRSNDTMAVVDSRARVYGVQNLRVVDASAFPLLTPGHPQSVVYMLAEKIADDILNGR